MSRPRRWVCIAVSFRERLGSQFEHSTAPRTSASSAIRMTTPLNASNQYRA